MCCVTPAIAQSSAADGAGEVEEIVVTGTRIIRDGYQAPTPLTVLGEEAIRAAAPYNLADYVNQLPSVIGSLTPRQSAGNASGGITGVNALNLRGMGRTRTLVLLDGQRSVGASVDGTVDVGSLPQGLVSRIDVVTGGASAAYGSDAVAGVANFILDKEYVGLKGVVEGGITTYRDNKNWKAGITAGTGFAGGRGHFVIDGEAAALAGIAHGWMRDWNNSGFNTFPNPAYTPTNGLPQYISAYGSGPSTATPGGLITTTALKGTTFGEGGVPLQFNYGPVVGGNFMQGGDWQAGKYVRATVLDPPAERQNLFARASYDLAENVKIFLQLSWAQTHTSNEIAYNFHLGTRQMRADNAFLPSEVAARATALGISQFNFGKFYMDLSNRDGSKMIEGDNTRITNRYVMGGEGDFNAFGSAWNWTAYYQKGVTRTSEHQYNAFHNTRMNLALDAVRDPATGSIVCRSTLTDRTNGCIPYNPFGLNVNSGAVMDYLLGEGAFRYQKLTQDVLAVAVRGEPFSLPAGAVSFATGFERRKENVSGTVDATSAASLWFTGNYGPTIGEYTVNEGFVEAVLPIASDAAWARSLDVNAAARLAHYSNSGSEITWKAGLTYQPIDDIRFRITRSRDIRAPNLGDLYTGGSSSAGAQLQDPFNGNVATPSQQFPRGNPNLIPERADTTGIGVVVQPAFVSGLSASVDYWNINLKDGIGSITAQQILTNCFLGRQSLCEAITREPGPGGRILVQVVPFNIGNQITRGIDIEGSYRVRMDEFADTWGGELSIRALVTRYLKNYIDDGITQPVERVGSHQSGGLDTGGPPRWVYNTSLTYRYAPLSVALTARGISSGVSSNAYVECTSGCPASTLNNPTVSSNFVPAAFYMDASINYDVTENISAFFRVQNIADKDPPPIPVHTGGAGERAPPTNRGLYDIVGRDFRAGIRFRM